MSVRFILVLFCTLIYFVAESQISVQLFTTKDGLKSNNIGSINQTENGFIWFQNAYQLCMYNGKEFKYFPFDKNVLGLNEYNQQILSLNSRGVSVMSGERPFYFDGVYYVGYSIHDTIEISSFAKLNSQFDKYGNFITSVGDSYFLLNHSGAIKIPTHYYADNTQFQYEVRLSEQREFFIVKNDSLFILNGQLQIERHASVPSVFNNLYCFLNHDLLYGYDLTTSVLHVYFKNEHRTFPIEHYNMTSIMAVSQPVSMCDDSTFTIFLAGNLITEKTHQYDELLRDIPSYFLLNDQEVILYHSTKGLIYKNYITNEIHYIPGLPAEDCVVNFLRLINGDIAMTGSFGLAILNRDDGFEITDYSVPFSNDFPAYRLSETEYDETGIVVYKACNESAYDNIQVDPDGFGFEIPENLVLQFKDTVLVLQPDYKIVRDNSDDLFISNQSEILHIKGPYFTDMIIEKTDFLPTQIIYFKNKKYLINSRNGMCLMSSSNGHDSIISLSVGWSNEIRDSLVIYGKSQSTESISHSLMFLNLNSLKVDTLFFENGIFETNRLIPFSSNSFDSKENLWLVTPSKDLVSVNSRTLDTVYYPKILKGEPVYGYCLVDSKDQLTVYTSSGIEIINLKDEMKATVFSHPILAESNIYDVAEDHFGNMFFSTASGIYWINLSGNRGDKIKALYEPYDRNHENSSIQVRSDSTVTITSDGGILIKVPKKFQEKLNLEKPSALIESIQINGAVEFNNALSAGKKMSLENVSLAANQNNLKIAFSSIEYRNHNQISYRYRVSGFIEEWRKTESPIVELNNMSYGNYTVEFVATYKSVDSEIARFSFTILPPWYHTWWARALYVLTGLFLIYFFMRWRTSKLRSRQAQLERDIEKATAEIREQREAVEHQKEQVEEAHKEITDSINYAERLQRSLMSSKKLLDENLGNYFVYFNPKEAVSGDFYWSSELPDKKFVLVCADSTGHGVPGAIMSMMNMNSLKEAVKEDQTKSDEILNHTRKTIIQTLSNDGSAEGGKDGMDAVLLIFNHDKTELEFSLANNPMWIIRAGELLEFKADKMPVGRHDKQDTLFTRHTEELQKGDLIYIFTDGFADQFGGEKGKKFKYSALKELLLSISEKPMEEQKTILSKTFENWRGNLEQVDDVCVIGIRI